MMVPELVIAWNSSSIEVVYSRRICLCSPAFSLSTESSPRRLLKPRKSAKKPAQRMSQGLIHTPMATAPATARKRKPRLIIMMSRMTCCLPQRV